ncbi:hypothetical protein ACFP2F_02360 [Hymenobacter artigasi]|uniref:Uncharacterized protein n=1 Tax=Hymenobacter artigasi TaxID=2719616 RepID=A0ABX1HDD1_9BACT|nr:hypothetical protein [Hymenobacter artigasi]NKI87895.1 hypothetical protein [Hymenobacter artigasi]
MADLIDQLVNQVSRVNLNAQYHAAPTLSPKHLLNEIVGGQESSFLSTRFILQKLLIKTPC